MPIEIREVVIRAEVGPKKGAGETVSPGGPGSGQATQALIQECVDQVMEILKEKSER